MKRWDDQIIRDSGQTKLNRFAMMKSMGLNCPEYEAVTIDNYKELAEKYIAGASIRCYGDGDWPGAWVHTYLEKDHHIIKMPPHAPSIKGGVIPHALYEFLQCGWKPMITDVISMEDNLFSGCIITERNPGEHFNTFILDAAIASPEKPVGVRNISHGGKVDITVRLPNGIRGIASGAFADIYKYLKPLRQGNWYAEFGYLRRPAGRLMDKPIFWDLYQLKERRQ